MTPLLKISQWMLEEWFSIKPFTTEYGKGYLRLSLAWGVPSGPSWSCKVAG